MEMLVTKFSNGKYRNEGELFKEVISSENVKLMGEMIALQDWYSLKMQTCFRRFCHDAHLYRPHNAGNGLHRL